MLIETNVTLYKCEHCKKTYRIKHYATKHESTCFKNPQNDRPCFHCRYLDKETVETDGPYSTIEYKVFVCKAKDINMYPPKCETKSNALDFGERNEPMPKTCEIYDKEQNETDEIISKILIGETK